MKSKIVIVGLNYEYNLKIGNLVCDKTDFYFLDVRSYLDYTLFSRRDMLDKCGVDYLANQENNVVSSCANFENTFMCMPYDNFFRNEMYKKFTKNSLIIYIHFSHERLSELEDENGMLNVDLICYEDRVKNLKKVSNHTVVVQNKKDETVIQELLNIVGGNREHK